MKKILFNIILIAIGLNVLSQERHLLSYFNKIKEDSIVNTRKMHLAELCSRFYDHNVPDSITLKYFFDNDTANLYFEYEGYNVDDHTYTYFRQKKLVCPFFYKRHEGYYLLCYDIDNLTSLSIYDAKCDKILSSYVVGDYTDEYGNQVTHSIIFPNNYIASVEIKYGGDVFYKLLKIDIDNKTFVLIKSIKTYGGDISDQEIYKRTYEILGINEKGELIK